MVDDVMTTKVRMYDALRAGCFGNTIPQWFSLDKWLVDPEAQRYQVWGVRTLTPGGPCRLFCPTGEVPSTVADYESKGHRCNISIMIDAILNVTLFADAYDSETGLRVYAVEYPGKGASWRKAMPEKGKQYDGLAARLLLRKHMNAASLADLEAIFERWPGHVVEFSACDRNFGTVPGRNCVIWEVRKY